MIEAWAGKTRLPDYIFGINRKDIVVKGEQGIARDVHFLICCMLDEFNLDLFFSVDLGNKINQM